MADRKMLKQMLRALIDNSVKFTLEDGTIMKDLIIGGKEIQKVRRKSKVRVKRCLKR